MDFSILYQCLPFTQEEGRKCPYRIQFEQAVEEAKTCMEYRANPDDSTSTPRKLFEKVAKLRPKDYIRVSRWRDYIEWVSVGVNQWMVSEWVGVGVNQWRVSEWVGIGVNQWRVSEWVGVGVNQ